MADTLPPSNAALKALGPVMVYEQSNESKSFAGQFYEPTNQFVPRPFKAGDPLGRSYGTGENGYLAIYYVVYTTYGPFWSKQYLKLADRGKAWEQSDGTGPPDPVPPLDPDAPKPPDNPGIVGTGTNPTGTAGLTAADPVFAWLKQNWVLVAVVAAGLLVLTVIVARR